VRTISTNKSFHELWDLWNWY